MNVHREISPSSLPAGEMARLHGAGFSLLPLGGGSDGKSPLIGFKGVPKLPLKRVLGPMHRTGSNCYGVRLGNLAVVDCDEDYPALIEQMEARFGVSPVHVRTPRGVHLYYKSAKGTFPNLRGEGLPVDIKRGVSSYVMGPASTRPDGGVYEAFKGLLGGIALPGILIPQITDRSNAVREGNRHTSLTTAAISMVEAVDSQDELFGNLEFIRDEECENPQSISDDELNKIAAWAWSRRLEGKVYRGRNSEFRLRRDSLDALKGLPNASDAIALFVTLQDLHGHIHAKSFVLDYAAMKDSKQTDLSRRRFLAARRTLENSGLLQIAAEYSAGKHARFYRLARIHPCLARGEGTKGYICRPVLVQSKSLEISQSSKTVGGSA